MLRWPSPWQTTSTAPPPPKTPSVIDKWLVDTGRKPSPPVRYTARRRRGTQESAPAGSGALSFPLVWPSRSDGQAPACAHLTPKRLPFDGAGQRDEPRASARGSHEPVTRPGGDIADDSNPYHEAEWDDPSYVSIYNTSPTDWRERITEMIDMGMTHYNVCNCTEGMPTKDEIERYDTVFREVVAANPEVGAIEVIPGYPPVYVLLGAAKAAELYAERRQRDRFSRQQR
nr:hypothetical protein [Pandoravirus massiliensis]